MQMLLLLFFTLGINSPEEKQTMLCTEAVMVISPPPGRSCHVSELLSVECTRPLRADFTNTGQIAGLLNSSYF